MYRQGDILLIPIPFSDLATNKQRPVLVLSNSKYNQKTEDLVVVAITSNLSEKEYAVIITQADLDEGNLKVDSCVRADKIYTLAQKIVIKRFGRVKQEVLNNVKSKLDDLLQQI